MQVQKYRFGVRLRRLPDLYPLVATCEVVVPTWERPRGADRLRERWCRAPRSRFCPREAARGTFGAAAAWRGDLASAEGQT